MSFLASFEKASQLIAEEGITNDSNTDATVNDATDGQSHGMGGRRHMFKRSRPQRDRQTGQAAGGRISTISEEPVMDPHRTSHYKRWYNSRYPG